MGIVSTGKNHVVMRWTSQELQDFQGSIQGEKTKPCLLSVRQGDLFHHGLDECCPKHLEGDFGGAGILFLRV